MNYELAVSSPWFPCLKKAAGSNDKFVVEIGVGYAIGLCENFYSVSTSSLKCKLEVPEVKTVRLISDGSSY